jgi:Flp pilus assembly protein TadD
MKSHYEILEIDSTADAASIKKAWARLVREHTPDQDPEGNRLLSEAKSVLLDPQARADYDAQLHFGEEITELMEQGQLFRAEEDYDDAIQCFKEVLAFHPKSLEARNQLALCYSEDGQNSEAIQQFRKLISLSPKSALYASNLGLVLWEASEDDPSLLQEAQTWLEKSTELESHNSAHYIRLARFFRDQKKFAEAEASVEAAIGADGKVDSDDIQALMELPIIYLFSNQKNKISGVAKRIKSLVPNEEEARLFAAYLFMEVAVKLTSEHQAYQDAIHFVNAAKAITNDLGSAAETAKKILADARAEREADIMVKATHIHPAVVPRLWAMLAYQRLGFNVSEESIQQLWAALKTWSRADITLAAFQCQREFPAVSQVASEFVSNAIGQADVTRINGAPGPTPTDHRFQQSSTVNESSRRSDGWVRPFSIVAILITIVYLFNWSNSSRSNLPAEPTPSNPAYNAEIETPPQQPVEESPPVGPSLSSLSPGEEIWAGLIYERSTSSGHELSIEVSPGTYGSVEWNSDDFPTLEEEASLKTKVLDRMFPRPSNDSDVLPPRGGRGLGMISIKNNGDSDAAVMIKPTGRGSRRQVYIRAGAQGRISGIRAGTYEVLARTGQHWDRSNRKFLTNEGCFKFDDTFDFIESDFSEDGQQGTRYSTWSITLEPTAGGNASRTTIDPSEFE